MVPVSSKKTGIHDGGTTGPSLNVTSTEANVETLNTNTMRRYVLVPLIL